MEGPLNIELDRDAEVPLGVQLAWALRARIRSRDMPPGQRLPGVRELAAATGVNPNTVRAVYARLEAEGLVDAQHGRGTFVARGARRSDRLGDVAQSALDAAREAGIDPREVAAAVWSGGLGPSGDSAEAAEKRRLRSEIAELERRLAEEPMVRRMAPLLEDAAATPPQKPKGRILSLEELRAQRDDLAGRLRLLEEAGEVEPASEAASRASSTGANRSVSWTLRFG